MTKADLIDDVSRRAELTRKDSEVKSRVGRNPKTGDRVKVPAKKIPFFTPSKELKDMVNSYGEQHPHLQAAPESTGPLG